MVFNIIMFTSILMFQLNNADLAEVVTKKKVGSLDLNCSMKCYIDDQYQPEAPRNRTSGFHPDSCNNVVDNIYSKAIVVLSSGLEVMCDTETEGGGWLVIQRRFNGELNFYRGWQDYKKGFGDYVNGEFYLGNENIHHITTNGTYELRIDFDYNNSKYYAKYSRFYLYGENDGYKLHVSGYTGNAGDSFFSYHNNMKFTTYDKDFDEYGPNNCAVLYKGGWWYKACHKVNFNGIWNSKEYGLGVNWQATTGHHDSATRTEIKIRKNK
ncbi:BgMsFReDn5 [Biomphalaria glabrata]|nr:microfibril-associated glycoprotein 4-like [Biomphalaria glabrata]